MLIVESGVGLANAESYVSAADCEAYAEARGAAFDSGTDDAEPALRRATTWLDNTYRLRYPGFRRNLRSQALEWPRTGVVDINGFAVAFDAVPIEIINAVCEAAIRELASAGSLAPDLDRGGAVKSLKAGSVAVEYGPGASANTTFQVIDGILQPLIGGGYSMFTAMAVRS